MDDNYLRQRTDEILRERIRLGMTGGEYMPGEELIDIRYAMDPRRGSAYGGKYNRYEKTWAKRISKCKRKPPKRAKTMEKCADARIKLRSSLMKKKDLGKREEKMLRYLERELKSKGRKRKAPVKKHRKVARLPKGTKGRTRCVKQPNPWLEFVCLFRAQNKGVKKFQGREGQKKLLHEASLRYPKWRKTLYGYGEGGVLIGGEDY